MDWNQSRFEPFGWVPNSLRMLPEYNILGFYITPIIFVFLAAILLGIFTAWLATKARLERFIWHPPLFLLGLIFVYGFVLALMFLPR